ncbi:MAG: formate dehydrogenase subunit alpha [Nitrospiraceae bacterium]|nr:MAG: formate dehydrogenase subunit alpha [Nitrospiraceae bacterium]
MAGLAATLGAGAMSNSIGEIENSPVIFVIGSNANETHPVIASCMKRAVKKGNQLIVADPRRVGLTRWATRHFQHKVGSDIALLNSVMYEIIRNGWHDTEFIENYTEGFEDIKKTVEAYAPERVADICGLSPDEIRELARILGTAEKAALFYTLGITEHVTGTDNVKTCANLQILLGNLGKEGTGVNPLRGQNNVQGACDVGVLPDVLTAYQKVSDSGVRKKFAKAWNIDSLPDTEGTKIPAMFDGMLHGEIRALYLMGENVVMSEPNQAHTIAALEKLDLLIVQDIFFNETAQYAHVVLPAACFAEKDGTFTNTERRVQRVNKAVEPPGQAKEDWRIVSEIAGRMGYVMGYASAEQIWDEIRSLTPSMSGITYGRIEREGIQWPCPDTSHPGTCFLYCDNVFPCGRARFKPAHWRPPAETPDPEYPFVLTTGRRLWHYHTGTQTRRSGGFEDILPEELIEVSREDAAGLGISDGEYILAVSRRGKVRVKAWVTDRVPQGLCFMTFHFHEACSNALTNDAFDPVTATAEYKACAIRLEKGQ